MKFAVAGLVTLFAVCAQSSAVWPYAAWPHAAPITQYSSYPALSLAHAAPISYAAHVAAPHVLAAPHVVSAPHAYSVAAHHAYAAPHVIAAPHVLPVAKLAATYTAANRGSVHTAPLPGHALSQTSLNVAPAPGTL